MKLITTIKHIISEKLGVPDNIDVAAEYLYNTLLSKIHNSIPIDDLVDEELNINANIKVADMPIKGFHIIFKFEEYPENVLAGVEHYSHSEYSGNYSLVNDTSDVIELGIRIMGDKDMIGKDVKKILSDDRDKTISIFAHEIKHHYDSFKQRYEGLKTRIDYSSKSNVQIGNIKPINEFILNLYYIHNIENLVRPSELYSNIKTGRITKSDFYKFFTEHNTFERLKKIKNFTYDKFIEILKSDIDNIKAAFDFNDIEYIGMTDDEIITKLLVITLTNLNNFKGAAMKDLLTQSFGEQILGLRGKKQEYLNSFFKSLELDMDNPGTFFKKEIKTMNINADKMIKKLAKLYDMAEDNTEFDITEITLVHDEAPRQTNKFDKEFKYWSKEKKHPIKRNKPSK
jgi:hypothetical protein